ncbi:MULTISPECIES: Gfo/Idh/MocA family protein [Thermoanaerobacterium]|uniref:Oxidoreductase domain-containing protein n=2 Tax=Thermoanaerobacterium TaxID=28895 RepID=W9EEI8_9THEO|nr:MULTISPECIES: Gfo/Idh/MocA family oxidoreductase [Thermoanaerobacterium]AFK86457.1 oxidoreductase domain protein [Thermoanaerobacterium saccharolyticum JW/SL-YS485]ETO38174.1 oxidoreductase domain-containing protein [Thermoanaerobacterium aotearoense SCUT27]
MSKENGMYYMPESRAKKVCGDGEFKFAAIGLDHGHIYGMTKGLIEAGAEVKWAYDKDPEKVERFIKAFPTAKKAKGEDEILMDSEVRLVASAAIPSERCDIGLKAMDAGKDYFADKPPMTTWQQLEKAKEKVKKTSRKYAVYYGERLHNEASVYAGQLIEKGAIGRVIQVLGMGPHREGKGRPDWFYEKDKFGGILCDIGSHQIEQFLYYTGAKDAKVQSAKVANYNHKQYPTFEDFGDVTLIGDNGATGYFRLDWFTPDGLGTWGDGRLFILGTEGYIELRKYIDVARENAPDHVYLVNKDGEFLIDVKGKVGFPFFGDLILDSLNRTENAMTQEHIFKAIELALEAQTNAIKVE